MIAGEFKWAGKKLFCPHYSDFRFIFAKNAVGDRIHRTVAATNYVSFWEIQRFIFIE